MSPSGKLTIVVWWFERLGLQLAELSGKDYEVWPFWKRCVTVDFDVSKDSGHSHCSLCLMLTDQDVSSQLFPPQCLFSAIINSIPLKP